MRKHRQWFVALCIAAFSACAHTTTPNHMMGCYALQAGGAPEIRFALERGQITWTVRRRSGWQKQKDIVKYFDAAHPASDIAAATFEKFEGMLDMGDGFFLIKIKPERLADVKGGHPASARALAEMREQGTPYLISANGIGPAFRVPCEAEKQVIPTTTPTASRHD